MGSVWFSKVSLVLLIIPASSPYWDKIVSELEYEKPIRLPDMANATLRELAYGYPENKGPYDYLKRLSEYNFQGYTWTSFSAEHEQACKSHGPYHSCMWFYTNSLKQIIDENCKEKGIQSEFTWDHASFLFMAIICGKPETKPKWDGCPSACYGKPCYDIRHALAGTCLIKTDNQVNDCFLFIL